MNKGCEVALKPEHQAGTGVGAGTGAGAGGNKTSTATSGGFSTDSLGLGREAVS